MNVATISRKQLEMNQGRDQHGRPFGFVHGDEGGFFFTWMSSLGDTLDSVEEDSESSDGGLDRDDVIEFLRRELPKTRMGQDRWGEIETMFVVRDASGEYVANLEGKRTPASDEAMQFATREEAQSACDRATDRVLSREV